MPVPFTCPHCGHASQVADQYLGQTGPCASCGQMVTIGASPGLSSPPPPRGKSGSGTGAVVGIVIGVVLLVVLVCGGGMVALLLPAVQAAREAARRTQCMNHLKQISLALHTYHDIHGEFPPAYLADAEGNPMHSWRVLILPYIEEQGIYSQYRFDEPWDSPNNRQLAMRMPSVFKCPSDPAGATETHYMVIVGEGTPFQPGKQNTLAEISASPGGTSNTLMVVESTAGANWMKPADLDLSTMSMTVGDPAGPAIGAMHPGGANVAFCDASVRFIDKNTSPQTIQSMALGAGP
ncbi:MAG: DUF1559 domain-containing protein [Pirellulales bacterium]